MSIISVSEMLAKSTISTFKATHTALEQIIHFETESKLPTAQAFVEVLIDIEILLSEYSVMIQNDADKISNHVDKLLTLDTDLARRSSALNGSSGGGGSNW